MPINTLENRIIDYLIKNPIFSKKIISGYYGFDSMEIKKFDSLLDWNYISQNTNIQWNRNLIESYKGLLNWESFSLMPVFSDTDLIDYFITDIDWSDSKREGINKTIANNPYIKWSNNLIECYENYLDFYCLSQSRSVLWTDSLIEKYMGRWNWTEITGNYSIPWTLPLFEKYSDFFDYSSSHFVSNLGLISNFEIVEKYWINFIPYVIFSNGNLPWIENDLLKRWGDKLDWEGIAGNEKLLVLPDFFEQNIEKWMNPTIVRSAFSNLSDSKVLPWSFEFINRFINYWDWRRLSLNPSLPWSEKFIEYYLERWDLPLLNRNHGIPWTIDLIDKYEETSCEILIKNRAIWQRAFMPYMNKNMIDTVLRLI